MSSEPTVGTRFEEGIMRSSGCSSELTTESERGQLLAEKAIGMLHETIRDALGLRILWLCS